MKKITLTVLIVYIFCGLFVKSLFAQNKGYETIKQQLENAQDKPRQPETIILPKVEYNTENMRDPFVWQIKQDLNPAPAIEEKTSAEQQVQPPPLKVTGMIWGGKFPQAIVDGKVVKAGDKVQGARIISIDKEGVKVSYYNKIFNLSSPATGQLENLKTNPAGGTK